MSAFSRRRVARINSPWSPQRRMRSITSSLIVLGPAFSRSRAVWYPFTTLGVISTTSLSLGQRKRMALVSAYLEDRPIYLFDEWAADQDPVFRKKFYEDLLPELKRLGKTIIAITHDDHYFHVADRRLKMEYGRLVADEGARRV